LDAELSAADDQGRLLTCGKVAAVAVVGNKDGAHHATAEVLQALNEVGSRCRFHVWGGRGVEHPGL
jgi:hypothetical protein